MVVQTGIAIIASIGCFVLGLIVAIRERGRFVPTVMASGLAVLSIEQAMIAWFSFHSSPMPQNVSLVTAFLPGIWMVFSTSFGRANYPEFLKRWKWMIGFSFLIPLSLAIIPFGEFIQPVLRIDPSEKVYLLAIRGFLFYLSFILLSTLILTNLEKTLRSSIGRIRWQIKFALLGLGAMFATRIFTSSEALLYSSWGPHLDRMNGYGVIAFLILSTLSLRRSQTLSFDLYLSTTVLRGSITVLAVGAYLVGVGLVVQILRLMEWETTFEEVVILLAGIFLVLALFSDRVRQSTRLFIQRHLRRPSYDYRLIWNHFNQSVANNLNEDQVAHAVVGLTANFLECLSVSLYLKDPGSESFRLIASTSRQKTEKRDQDRDSRQKKRLLVSLKVKDEELGRLEVGERVRAKEFSFEDKELLEVLADQTAAILMNIRLSRQLQERSEREAFQAMSAFFIHDLKNLANRLSLTVQNLPRHYEKPEFREEALKTISQSVEKIKGMCSQLSSLREKLELSPEPANLSSVVAERIQILMTQVGEVLQLKTETSLPVRIDGSQFVKVIDNLVLNAKEALVSSPSISHGEESWIKVRTYRGGKYAVLEVSDNGSGMTREFLENRLFQPFQTTKKQGMGIGLYQSRMIVEKHGGRIEVDSVEDQGSTFRILLPIVTSTSSLKAS